MISQIEPIEPQPTKTIEGNFPKFRIWDEDKKKFYYSGQTLIMKQKNNSVVVPFTILVDYPVKKDFVVSITEFTGILESTPKMTPIYTGDIVVTSKDNINPIEKKIVNWSPQIACFNVSLDLINGLNIVVIGNIFQNKDKLTPPKPTLDLSGNIDKALKELPN